MTPTPPVDNLYGNDITKRGMSSEIEKTPQEPQESQPESQDTQQVNQPPEDDGLTLRQKTLFLALGISVVALGGTATVIYLNSLMEPTSQQSPEDPEQNSTPKPTKFRRFLGKFSKNPQQ